MERVALILGDTFLYWNSIVLVLSGAAAVCLFLWAYLGSGGSGLAASVAVPAALVGGVFFSRLIHWYFRPDSYSDALTALTDYTAGGYALPGVFCGCALAAVLARLLRLEGSLLRLLDAMSLGLCVGIGLGRLSCFFSAADRGQVVSGAIPEPIAWPAMNAVSAEAEYRLATFLLQAVFAGVLGLILWGFFLTGRAKRGEVTLFFLLLYAMGQTVLDSTRYDSLYLRSNGFLRVTQLLSAVTLAAAGVFCAVRMVRQRGFRLWNVLLWIVMAAALAGAGYMEYFVQRHGDRGLFCYSIMTACVVTFALLALMQYVSSVRGTEDRVESED